MKKIALFGLLLLIIFIGGYFILWPGPSKKVYEENVSLFDYQATAPLDIQITSTEEYSTFQKINLTFASPAGGVVAATLFTPGGTGPYPALILMHGMPGQRQDMFGIAHHYVRAGAVVITIDAPQARDQLYGQSSFQFNEQDRADQIQLIQDLRRTIDLLVARSDVDSNQIAYVGLSYGGAMGGLLAGVEDRLQAYVLMVGDGGLVSHFTGPDNVFGTLSVKMDKVERQSWIDSMWPIEPIHYIGHAEPAAILYQSASKDEAVSLDDSLRYHWAGSQPKNVIWYDSGHWPLPGGYLTDQADWLAQYLDIETDVFN